MRQTVSVIRVAVLDDHPVMREGIEHVLDGSPGLTVVSSAGSVGELEKAAADPQVVVLDLYLDGRRPAIEAIEKLSERCRVLVISAFARRADVLAAIRAGAAGYLTKQADPATLLDAVAQVAAGKFYLSSQLADIVHADYTASPDAEPAIELSDREEEALRYIAEGLTHRQTANRMGVKSSTVDTYVKRIRAKTGLGNKADLARLAFELGQTSLGPPA
jgi:two-component system, NarL family, nitrate/nitrite response regulator NarL